MAIHPVLTPPAPELREIAKPVDAITDEVRAIFDDMLETMYDDKGIGLAGNQIGVLKRLITIDLQEEGEAGKMVYYIANPELVWKSEEKASCQEGCLSVPGMYAEVTRPAQVHVKYTDYHGKEQLMKADGLLAACIQHEMDHLNGVLFVDHLSSLKRNMILRKFKKQSR